MKISRLLILLIFFQFWNLCSAQEKVYDTTKLKKLDLVLSSGYVLQGNSFGELNLLIGKVIFENGKFPILGLDALRVGLESNFRNNENQILAPKIGLELSNLFVIVRLSFVNYFQHSSSEFRIIPEIGFSLGGLVNLTYGYGINLNNGNISGLSKHRLGISINLNKTLRKGVKEIYGL
tara:strand:- start:332 stop:865 length:534 start_codon:yes stop_codon:yes gene_type:complete